MHARELTADEVQLFIKNLDTVYKNNNASRIKLIQFVQQTAIEYPSLSTKALLGLLHFMIRAIDKKADYSLTDNLPNFFGEGSTLKQAIIKFITAHNPENLSAKQQLICLRRLVKAIDKNQSPLISEFTNYNCSFFEALNTIIDNILNSTEIANNNKTLIKKRPTASALKQNFSAIPSRYQELKGSQTGRETYLEFIKFIDLVCAQNGLDHSFTRVNNILFPSGYLARLAAIICLLSLLENEYTFTSKLQQVLIEASNIDCSTEVPVIETQLCCQILRPLILSNAHLWKDKDKATRTFFANMDTKVKDIIEAIDNRELKDEPHPNIDKFSKVVEIAATFGITITVGYYSGNLAQKIFSPSIVKSSASLMMYGIMKTTGGFLFHEVESIVENNILPAAVGKTLNYSGGLLGSCFKFSISGLVYSLIALPVDGINKITEFCLALQKAGIKVEPHNNDDELVETLLELPTISEQVKRRLRNTVEVSKIEAAKEMVSTKNAEEAPRAEPGLR